MKLKSAVLFFFSACAFGVFAGEPPRVVSKDLPGAQAATNGISGEGTNEPPKPPGILFTNSVGMELIKAGGYWAGIREVTQKEFQEVMKANPSAFGGDRRPVDNVSWDDAIAFCKAMTAKDIAEKFLPAGFSYTLPEESEWESFVGDASLTNAITSLATRLAGTSPVGALATNNFGLFDVRGNVAEFCLGNPAQPFRVLRGGSWQDWIEVNLRIEFRIYCKPDERKNTFGFRCVLKPD